jgi:hypothetical protein
MDTVDVTVSALDSTTVQVHLDVPNGADRHIEVFAYDADGNLLYYGHTYTDLDGTAVTLTIKMEAMTWAKTYGGISGDYLSSMVKTADGGYITAGVTDSFGVSRMLWVLKLKSDGSVIWQKAFERLSAASIRQTNDGGYVIAGGRLSSGMVLRLNPDGTIQWLKTYSYPDTDNGDYLFSIEQTSDGGFIAVGEADPYGDDWTEPWIIRLNPDGTVLWQGTLSVSSSNAEAYKSVQQTSDGGYIAAGYYTGRDLLVVKYFADGTIDWQKTYGGAGNEEASFIRQTADGGYVVAGLTNSFGAGQNDIWILKLNPDSSVDWQKTYGDTGDESASSIHQTADGGYIVLGSTDSFGAGSWDFWALKLHPDGSVGWQRTYGDAGMDYGYAIQQDVNGGYVAAGRTDSYGAGSRDFWVIKMGLSGDTGPACDIDNLTNILPAVTSAVPALHSNSVDSLPLDVADLDIMPQDTPGEVNVQCGPSDRSAPTLTVTRTGAGSGAVTSAPAGIDCGGQGDCTEPYEEGTLVTLEAFPDAGSVFAAWGGDCSGTGVVTDITVDSITECTAEFVMNDSDGDGVPDGTDICPGFDDNADADFDGVPDGCDVCNGDDASGDTDGDGVCNDIDPCPVDNPDDTDGDGVCDSADICAGFDDNLDNDADGVPDGCDVCNGDDASGDTDGDGVCDDIDPCPVDNPDDTDGDGVCDSADICAGFDDNLDNDADGVPDGCDVCNGDDASGDTDGDGVCNDIDPCPVDNPDDTDSDGVCDSADICAGFDDNLDNDADGVPDGCDVCDGDDASGDTDGDGVCDDIDPCPLDNPDDTDSDGVCESDDICPGYDDNADSDGDGTPDGCDIDFGMLAYYPFNGNADDESGNGNHGTVNGAVLTTDRFFVNSSAYHFDGVNDFIQTPLDSNSLPFSFSVWFKPDSVSGERSIVDSDSFGQSGHSLILGYWDGDGDIDVQYHDSYIDTGYPVNTGQWYHAVVNISNTIQVYINGVLIIEQPYTPASLDGSTFRFGRHNASDPQWFAGDIDDIRFYGRVLPESAITELYNLSSEVSDKVTGTWGTMGISHQSWHTESGKVTLRDDGTGTNEYYRNDNGVLSSGSENFTYTITDNHDGSFTLTVIPESGGPAEDIRLVISDNGNMFIEDGTTDMAEQLMMVGIRLDAVTPYTDADFNGDFYGIGYEHDGMGNSYSGSSSINNADGAGTFTFTVMTSNTDGVISNPVEPGMPYAVNADGSISIDGSAPTNFLSADGKLLTHSNPDTADDWENGFLMKKADRAYATSDIEGEWAFASFGDYQGTEFMSGFGGMTCDAAGNCMISERILKSDGSLIIETSNDTVSVSADGSFGGTLPGGVPYSAAIGNDGNTFIVN